MGFLHKACLIIVVGPTGWRMHQRSISHLMKWCSSNCVPHFHIAPHLSFCLSSRFYFTKPFVWKCITAIRHAHSSLSCSVFKPCKDPLSVRSFGNEVGEPLNLVCVCTRLQARLLRIRTKFQTWEVINSAMKGFVTKMYNSIDGLQTSNLANRIRFRKQRWALEFPVSWFQVEPWPFLFAIICS